MTVRECTAPSQGRAQTRDGGVALTALALAPGMQGRITMDCECVESRIRARHPLTGETEQARVKYTCGAKEHKAPRYALPVLPLCLPAPEVGE